MHYTNGLQDKKFSPAIDWLPEDMALSITYTKRMNKKGATTSRIKVEVLFRKATLAADSTWSPSKQ